MAGLAKAAAACVVGGLAGAAADLVGARLISGAPFAAIGKYIARGWLGKEGAAAAGDQAIWLGIASHFGIGILCAAIYLAASRALPVLARRPVICGLVFGLAVFFTMHLAVLPLSGIGAQSWPKTPVKFVADVASNALFGFIIAVLVTKLAPPSRQAETA